MNNDQNKEQKSFLEMARGAFVERADYEIAKIFENILDANTSPTQKRKLTITATFVPDGERQNVHVAFEAKSTLATVVPATTALYIAGIDSNGVPQVVEMTPQIPGQVDIFGNIQEAPPMLRVINTK